MAHPSPPSDPATPDSTLKPDAAVDLLNDLEERLGALRNWQNQSEAQAEHVRQQTREMDDRRKSLETLQKELEAERGSLDARASELDTQRGDLDAQREQLDANRQELADEQARIDQRRDQLQAHAADVEAQLEAKHRQLEDTEKQKLDAIAEQERAAAESQNAIEEARERAQAREHRLDEAFAKLRDDEAALAQTQEELRAKLEELEGTAAQLDQRQTELDERAARLDADRAALDDKTQQIDTRLAEVEQLKTQAEQGKQELDTARAELDAQRTEFDQQRGELDQARTQLASDRKELHRVQLDQQLRTEALQAQEQALNKARAELIEQASSGSADTEDQTRRDAKLAEAVAVAEQHRQEAEASAAQVEELRGRIEERERELRDLQAALDASTSADPQDQADLDADDDALVAEFADDNAPDDDATDTDTGDLRALIAQRETEIASLREELDTTQRELGDRVAEVELLTERIEELTDELKQARASQTSTGPAADDEESQRRRAELDEQASQIAADRQRILERKAQLKQADAIIQKRRDKIRQYIRQIKDGGVAAASEAPAPTPAAPTGPSASDQARIAGIEKERAALREVKTLLEQSEAVMVRRWATQRTTSVVTSVILAITLSAGVAFYVGQRFAIPVYQATLTMQIVPIGDGEDLPPGAWLAHYKTQLLSAPVLGEVLNQLDQKGVRIAGDANELADHFRETLAVTGSADNLQLAYHGESREQITKVLEAVGEGLLTYHMIEDRRAGRLSDSAAIAKPALAPTTPLQDDTLKFAGATFAGLIGLAALIALPLRFIFGRSRRVLHPKNMPELAVLDRSPEDWVEDADTEDAEPAEESAEDEEVFRF